MPDATSSKSTTQLEAAPVHADPEEEQEEEYEIEAILDARVASRSKEPKFEYLVSWKGYGPSENSWVSHEDASNAQELIDEYWTTRKKPEQETARALAVATSPLVNASASKSKSLHAREVADRNARIIAKPTTKRSRPRKSASAALANNPNLSTDVGPAPSRKRGRPRKSASAALANTPDLDTDEGPAPPRKRGRPSQRASELKLATPDLNTEPVARPGRTADPRKSSSVVNERASDTKAAATSKDAFVPAEEATEDMVGDMNPWIHLDDWEGIVTSIEGIQPEEDGRILVYLNLDDGSMKAAYSSTCNPRCPQKLLQYYEKIITFPRGV